MPVLYAYMYCSCPMYLSTNIYPLFYLTIIVCSSICLFVNSFLHPCINPRFINSSIQLKSINFYKLLKIEIRTRYSQSIIRSTLIAARFWSAYERTARVKLGTIQLDHTILISNTLFTPKSLKATSPYSIKESSKQEHPLTTTSEV